MRALRKMIPAVALVAVAGLMAFPTLASAEDNAWWDSANALDTTATLEVSGNLEVVSSVYGGVDCQVTGEIEVWNDWLSLDTPARNQVTSLQLAGSPATACDPTPGPYQCYPTSLSFRAVPWSGESSDFESVFNGASIGVGWGGDPTCTTSIFWINNATLTLSAQAPGCIEDFDIDPAYIHTHTTASGTLEVDGIQGLPGTPCLYLSYI